MRYSEYVNNFTTGIELLKSEIQSNPKFAEFVKKCENSPESNYQDLNDFLIQPIQRIPRYQLLLRDLIKNTDLDHPDYPNLTKSLAKVERIAKYINEQKRNTENAAAIQRISSLLTTKEVEM